MKKVNRHQFVSLLAIGAFAVANGTAGSAIASEGTAADAPQSMELAQGIVGQCRAAKRPIFIYAERSTTSNRIRSLTTNQQVTLADNGGGGWIAVSAPIAGFVQTADLKMCNQARPPRPVAPPTTADLCRRTTIDLNARSQPNLNARVVRLLRAGQQVTLTSDRETTDANGRVWAEISSPVSAWISTRPDEGRANVTDCTTSAAPPPPAPDTCVVAIPQGLRIWSSPTGTPVGLLASNQSATLTGQRQTIGNRVWVQISSPRQAWISSGFVNNEANISCS
ncbi:MAG: SH3 domain-containing protein [Cyanobacteriota bacterium]|nr:SH3 domain-containing protein [Cyanobacteriota bacterium]